jgi:hypothetical protein
MIDLYKIYIDPRCMFNYASYYILGCAEVLKNENRGGVKFDIAHFKDIHYNEKKYRQGMCIVLENQNHIKKNIYIDFHDSNSILDEMYSWSDVYAKINIDKNTDLTNKNKLFPIGPGFGIKIYNYPQLFMNLFLNYNKGCKFNDISLFRNFRDYLYTNVRRLEYETYHSEMPSLDNYVFTMSTLWYDRKTDATTNHYRNIFIRESKKQSQFFEGGFFYISNKDVIQEYPPYARYEEEFKDFIFHKRISPKEYVNKTKQSTIVFNTPAVGGCHGWKLGEYLCMGKAIISTPLNNLMPEQFLPGVHYHLVNNEFEIGTAIKLLLNDSQYRGKLEKSAKKYFDDFLSPEKVIQLIYNKAFNLE